MVAGDDVEAVVLAELIAVVLRDWGVGPWASTLMGTGVGVPSVGLTLPSLRQRRRVVLGLLYFSPGPRRSAIVKGAPRLGDKLKP